MCVGEKIKHYLINNGISQTHISRSTEIPLPKLNLALHGKRKLTFPEYELICGALNVGVDKFLEPKKPQNSDMHFRNKEEEQEHESKIS